MVAESNQRVIEPQERVGSLYRFVSTDFKHVSRTMHIAELMPQVGQQFLKVVSS